MQRSKTKDVNIYSQKQKQRSCMQEKFWCDCLFLEALKALDINFYSSLWLKGNQILVLQEKKKKKN